MSIYICIKHTARAIKGKMFREGGQVEGCFRFSFFLRQTQNLIPLAIRNALKHMAYLFNGTFEFIHVALKERKMGEEKVLKLRVFLLIG